jgi:1,4-alpha-glucan branching enzyme
MQPRHNRSTTVARPVAPTRPQRPDEKPVDFFLNLPGAKTACVAGTFNDWDTSRTPLHKEANGSWKATVWLPPGRYEYKFVIDGAQWFSDPGAKESVANQFGSTNSVVVV